MPLLSLSTTITKNVVTSPSPGGEADVIDLTTSPSPGVIDLTTSPSPGVIDLTTSPSPTPRGEEGEWWAQLFNALPPAAAAVYSSPATGTSTEEMPAVAAGGTTIEDDEDDDRKLPAVAEGGSANAAGTSTEEMPAVAACGTTIEEQEDEDDRKLPAVAEGASAPTTGTSTPVIECWECRFCRTMSPVTVSVCPLCRVSRHRLPMRFQPMERSQASDEIPHHHGALAISRNKEGTLPHAIQQLPVSSAFYPGTCCQICQQCYQVGEERRTLPCLHIFHTVCIDPWLIEYSPSCPVCRYEISSACF